MLHIVIPMAGAGSRFRSAGYRDPKPLIPIRGIPMIRLVIENLRPKTAHQFLFVCQREHVVAYRLEEKLSAWAPGCALVTVDGITEGAACTVLAARHLIDHDEPLMIANSDQYIDASIDDYLSLMDRDNLDGLIMTMTATDPKWSYVQRNQDGFVSRIAEKEVISHEATVGIYNYRHGRDCVNAIESMMAKNLRVNNEFYVAPAYNEWIAAGARIAPFLLGEAQGMHGLGTPKDLDLFLSLPISDRATRLHR